jgi:predicted  nucleic acid-binding Zn ribbon protein
MTEWLFKTPTVEEGPAGGARLFYFYRIDRGITIVMDDSGEYQQIRYPQDIDLSLYPQVYRGGYNHTVDDATKAALIAGDVGVTEDNFTAL